MISKIASIDCLNASQQRTLKALFQTPTPRSVEWRKIESLFAALGANIVEGSGSRVRFELAGVIATFHRPHPQKEAKPYQTKDARKFLIQVGIEL